MVVNISIYAATVLLRAFFSLLNVNIAQKSKHANGIWSHALKNLNSSSVPFELLNNENSTEQTNNPEENRKRKTSIHNCDESVICWCSVDSNHVCKHRERSSLYANMLSQIDSECIRLLFNFGYIGRMFDKFSF